MKRKQLGSHSPGRHALRAAPIAAESRKGGRRKATRSDRFRSSNPSRLPTAFGGLAIAVAVTGAVATTQAGFANNALASDSLGARHDYSGSDVVAGRQQAISRDSTGRTSLTPKAKALAADTEALASQRAAALQVLANQAISYGREIAANRWILPVAHYQLTGRFGDVSALWATVHTGLDFAAPTGTPIYSIAAGVVTSAGPAGSYGNRVIVRLRDGTEIWYCHQYRMMVSVGDHVTQDAVIGEIGSTGNTTGPHLHLEVRPPGSGPVDPQIAFPKHGITP